MAENLLGKEFPCPVCGVGLGIRLSHRGKPYCICDACGIQLFFRGKTGIGRLREIIESQMLIANSAADFAEAVVLYNRIQQLRAQKKELEQNKSKDL